MVRRRKLGFDRVFQLVKLVAQLVYDLRAASNDRLFVTRARFEWLWLDAAYLDLERAWSDADEPVAHAQLICEQRNGRPIKQLRARGPLVSEPVPAGEHLRVVARDF